MMKSCYFNLRRVLIVVFLLTIFLQAKSQDQKMQEDTLSFLFIGDVMGHDEQIWSAENRETHTYNYDSVFTYIKPVISEADIAIANLEVTLAGQPYTGYPQFSSPSDLAVACRNAGIDYFVTANNHSADRRKKGITGTINRLDSIGIPHTGTFQDSSCRDSLSPLMINKKGISAALLNYTFGTNGITVPEPVIVNPIDKSLIINDINKAKARNADVIIVFLHWGTEYDTIPSRSQTDLAEYLLSEGVDLVIGSHPHVLQKMVWSKKNEGRKDRVVVYSLGNFVSNQKKPKTEGGSIVRVEVIKKDGSVRISDAGYYLTWVYKPIVNFRKKFYVLPCSEYENRSDFFTSTDDYEKMKNFIRDSRAFLYKQNVNFNEYIFTGNCWLME
ncbi:MAG TPA: CapA family protein [Bacteroidales bacterium]|nr:CapA family protein [Bacteroidales bacterium]HPT21456.1 CapA family protein [Bacteroidales bacterium]